MEPVLVLLCGLPLSGKSTWAKQLIPDYQWVIVCPDTIRLQLHGMDFYSPAEPFVWATAELMTRALLATGHTVVIDATNTTKKRRQQWSKIAKELGVTAKAVVFDTPASECRRRAEANGNPKMVSVIDRMAEQWEPIEENEEIYVAPALPATRIKEDPEHKQQRR